jgi:exopolysaccharide biosynthesis protein
MRGRRISRLEIATCLFQMEVQMRTKDQRPTDASKPTAKPKKKRRFSKPLIVITIFLQIIIGSVISLLLVTRGPFETIRTAVIGSAMTTLSHQYIAKMLFSQQEIDRVTNIGKAVDSHTQDTRLVNVTKVNDPSIVEEVINGENGNYHGYMLEIADPTRVKLALTKFLGKTGQNTSDMAEEHDAVAAINGGGFGEASNWSGTGAEPSDFVFQDGVLNEQTVQVSSYNQKCDVIALDANGTLVIGSYSINDLLNYYKTSKNNAKIMQAVTLRGVPPLITNGESRYKNAQEAGGFGFAPRTVIGQKADGTILLLVVDGRRLNMKGASYYDVQQIMKQYGAVNATNLDGGNSSVMYFNGDVINSPSGEYGERPVATAFYVEGR